VFSLGDGSELLEDDPDDPMHIAIRQMRGVFAQLERGLIRQRMAKGPAPTDSCCLASVLLALCPCQGRATCVAPSLAVDGKFISETIPRPQPCGEQEGTACGKSCGDASCARTHTSDTGTPAGLNGRRRLNHRAEGPPAVGCRHVGGHRNLPTHGHRLPTSGHR
jgi:hypothetical protein